jgi:hypothetical protein
VLVEAVVDPFEPPMPPKVSLKQATKLAKSLMRGQPNREKIIATVLRDKVHRLCEALLRRRRDRSAQFEPYRRADFQCGKTKMVVKEVRMAG